jgi:hypothetical protein
MASQFIKNRAFIQKLKEPEVMDVDFNLEDSALDYSIESLEEDILPEAKPVELFEERERVRTERLSDTLTKIGGGLMDESVDFIKREEFAGGTETALGFGNQQKIFSPKSFQRILSLEGQKRQPEAYKIILKALKKAGIKYTPPVSTGKFSTFSNVTKKTVEAFNKEATKLKAEAGLPMSRYQADELKKEIKIFVKDKIKKGEYVSRPVIKEHFGIEGKSGDGLINRGLGIEGKTTTGLGKKLGKEEAKAASIETGKKAAEVKLKKADEVLKDINNEFKLDPDISDSEEMAKKIYGSDFEKADLKGKERLVRQTDNDVVTYLKVIRGSRVKPEGMKLPSQETINDIVDNIELGLADEAAEGVGKSRTKGFRFSPGILRDYKYALIDEALGLKQGTFVNQRNKFLVKGKELDEIFGLTSMSRNAPGYAEAVQVLSKKVNRAKRREIDLPMSKIVDALNNNQTTMKYKGERNVPISEVVEDFNKKSAAFAKKYNIRGPKINLGGNFNLSNYANFRPESKKNIEQVFKNKNYFLSEVNNKPFETMTSKSLVNKGSKRLSALQEIYSRQGMNLDPALAARAVQEEFINPMFGERTRLPASNRGIRTLATAGKIALPEMYFAPASIVLDTYAGRTPAEQVLNVATLGFGAPAVDAYKKAQVLKDLGYLSDYKKAMAKINRPDQALAEEVETLGMDTPAEEFAAPEFTEEERLAALIGQVEDLKLKTRLEKKAAEYQKLREDQLKKGLLEVTPEGEELPEDVGIQPEIPLEEEEEEEKSLGFFDKITGNIPRGFMSKGGIMAIRNKDKSDETN